MNATQLETVERIEAQLADIARREAELAQERQQVLESDEEYAGYLEQYEAFYDDTPLTIRAYYEKSVRLDEINALFNASGADYEAMWREHRAEIEYLERVLAA